LQELRKIVRKTSEEAEIAKKISRKFEIRRKNEGVREVKIKKKKKESKEPLEGDSSVGF
jgi:hypothetical protein